MPIKRFAAIRKKIINSVPLLTDIRNTLLINQTKKQFEQVDFEVKKSGGIYHISFTDLLGYKIPHLESSFSFDTGKNAYRVTINGKSFFTYTFPVPEIIRELRGYLLLGLPPAGKHIIDIGASNGFISMALASLIGDSANVYALEPDRSYIGMLQKNIAQNTFKNIRIIESGIYKEDGNFSFTANGDGSSRLTPEKESGTETISTQKMATFLSHNKITADQLGFIKMDIEGAEVDILGDLIAIIRENKSCIVAIASYHKIDNRLTSEIIEEACKAYPELRCITKYPYHPTTFLVHKDSVYNQSLTA